MTAAVVLPRESRAQNLFGDSGFSASHGSFSAVPYEHVDPLSGNLIVSVTDLALPGNAGLDLRVARSYNSKFHADFETGNLSLGERTPAGVGWRLHFGRVLYDDSSLPGQTVIETPDGGGQTLYQSTSHGWMSKNFWRYDRSTNTALLPNGHRYVFNHIGETSGPRGRVRYVSEIYDSFNNLITFEYASSGLPGSIWRIRQHLSGSQIREVTFTYNGNGSLATMNYDGRVWSYEYDPAPGMPGEWVLRRVVPPIGLPWAYVYSYNNAGAELTGLRPPGGGEINFAYATATRVASTLTQPSRVVTSRTTGGTRITPGTWTFTYNQGPNSDTTVVDCPCGKITYRYAGIGNTGDFSAWKSGVLLERTIAPPGSSSPLEREVMEYQASAAISPNAVTGVSGVWSDPAVYRALVTSRVLTRYPGPYSWTTNYQYNPTNYNDFGRPWRVTAQGDQTRTTEFIFDYNFSSHWIVTGPIEERMNIGQPVRGKIFTYNAAGFLTRSNTYGLIMDFEPNAAGQVARVTDAHNHQTTLTYSWGVLANTTTPLLTTTRTINPDGTMASETVGTQTTNYVYDAGGRIRRIRPPSWPAVNEIVHEYDDFTTYYVRTSRGTSQTEELLDGFGRVMSTGDQTGVKTSVLRDACGRVTRTHAAYTGSTPSRWTDTTYDALGRALTVTAPGSPAATTTYTYTGADVSVLDAEGRTTNYDYAAFSGPADTRLMRVTDALGNHTDYQYDVLGGLTSVAGPGPGPVRTWAYNTRGELIQENQPESGQTTYGYDSAGLLTSITNALNQVTTVTYDQNDRLKTRTVAGNTDSDVTINYDTLGRVQERIISGVVTTFEYDAAGRPSSRADAIHPGMTFKSWYTYDANDNLSTIRYPRPGAVNTGRLVTYQYDNSFRLNGVLNNGATFANQFLYDTAGRLQSFYTGVVGHSRFYDDRDRLTQVAAGPGIGHLRLYYEYDKVSNVKKLTDDRAGGPYAEQHYTYDVLNRMKTATGPWGALGWGYDPGGNRISEDRAGTTTYNYHPTTNRLTNTQGVNPESFGWTAAGQLSSNTRGATTTTYGYTPAGMLKTTTAPGLTASYLYDSEQMRVKREVNGRTYVTVRSIAGQVLSEFESCGGPVLWARDNLYGGERLLGAARASVTLPTITFVNPTLNVQENAGTVNVGVQLVTPNGAPLACDASVSFSLTPGTAAANSDFVAQSGVTVTFPMGSASGTTINRQVTINEDSFDEVDETFTATLTNASGALIGAQNTVAATIIDNDPTPTMTVTSPFANEAVGVAQFTVNLSAFSGRQVTVNYATANGSAVACTGGNAAVCDYTAMSGTLTLPPMTPSAIINVPLFNNTRAELGEVFYLNLSGAVNATLNTTQAIANITDDEVRAPLDPTYPWVFLPDVRSSSAESDYLQLFNYNTVAVTARTTVTWDNGTGLVRDFNVPALSRIDVDLNTQPGIGGTGNFSLTVQSLDVTRRLVPEVSGYLPPSFAGGRNDNGDNGPLPTWYFAEGSVSSFFDEYLTVFNPNNSAVDLTVTFVRPAGYSNIVRTYRINEGPGRLRLRLFDEVGAIADHGTIVSATYVSGGAAANILASRTSEWPMGNPNENASLMGRNSSATNWYFAEGGKGFWTTYVALLNPSASQTANVSIAYLHDNGLTYTQTVNVGPMQQLSVSPPASVPDGGFGLHVSSTNGVAINADRTMYGGSGWSMGHASRGTFPYLNWRFAEGVSNTFFDTYFLVLNPNTTAANVRLTFRRTDGGVIIHDIVVPARTRAVVAADWVPGVDGGTYATEIQSTNGVSILAERSVFWPSGNWSGSHLGFGRPQ